MNELATALLGRGHEVAVLSGLAGDGWGGLGRRVSLKFARSLVVKDERLGYPVFRSWSAEAGVADAIRAFRPDVAVPFSGSTVPMSLAFERLGVPSVPYYRNVEATDFGGDPASSGSPILANSCFTAARLAERYGVNATVIAPLFDASRYRTPGEGRHVTFINPHPDKGRDLAFAIARACPDIPFLFVRAWTLTDEQERELNRLDRACPNVELRARTDDMRSIYTRTRILIMPSRWEEAWGRAATEAQFSGIPVVATAIGGLPQSVGPGGVLLPHEAGADRWARVVREIYNDTEAYSDLSGAAMMHSQRDAVDPRMQIATFLNVLETAVNAGGRANAVARSTKARRSLI